MDRPKIDRRRTALNVIVVVAVIVILCLVFPAALVFVELAARELRYLWWLVLMIAFGAWLIWGGSRKPKE